MRAQRGSTESAVEVRGLTRRFGDHLALRGIDLDVPAGAVHAILGPNGAGKTTAVRILATLLPPSGGQARVFGRDVVEDATAVRRLIGLTGQYASLDQALTGRENLTLVARLLGDRRPKDRAAELLAAFGLEDAADRPAGTYSGGMRRRLDIATSLVGRPRLIFLDEPTTGLDPRTRTQMWDTVRDLVAAGSTVLLTTQYLEEADQLADRITLIDRGVVVAEDTADGLKGTVGGSALHLRLDPADAAEAARVLERLTGRTAQTDADGRVSVAVERPEVSGEAVLALHRAGISVIEVSVSRPSLDEVFFTLTGGDDTAPADPPPAHPEADQAREEVTR